jgi:pyrophosphatase PpaX
VTGVGCPKPSATIGAVNPEGPNIPTGCEPLASPAERLACLRAVLFDLDGTLIDTIELIRVSFRYATEKVLGEALPDKLTMANVGQPLRTQFEDLAPGRADELTKVYREFNQAHHDQLAKAYPGTPEVLQTIADHGVPMGIVTSKGTEGARRGLELFGLTDFFEVIVSADDVPKHKPDPFPLRFAASAMGVPLEYCVYIGDSPHDMQAAVSGGAIAVAALWGAFSTDDVLAPGPPFALRDIGELPALLFGDAGSYGQGIGRGGRADAGSPQARRT